MTDSDDPNDFTAGALAYMKRAAPERANALQELFDNHNVRVRHTSRNTFEQGEVVDPSPNAIMGTIQFPPVMHSLTWLLIHGGWEAMRNYGAAIVGLQMVGAGFRGVDIEAALVHFPEADRCEEIINCAVGYVYGLESPLPEWLPNINDINPGPGVNLEHHAVRELWFVAQCWFLLHELQHIIFRKEGKEFSSLPEEELACDARATAWILEGVECYSDQTKEPSNKVRGKRAMGILAGLFCIGWLSPPDGSETHPPLKERIKVFFQQVGDEDTAHFWYFSVGLLFALSKNRKKTEFQDHTSMRDIALQLAGTL